MLHLHPTETICLGHRADFITHGPNGSLFIASGNGRASMLNPAPRLVLAHWTGEGDALACSAHPCKPLVAIVGDEGRRLRVLHFDGERVFEGGPIDSNYRFEHCLFDPGGTRLWCMLSTTPQAIVECRDANDWSVVELFVLDNEAGEGSSRLEFCRPDLALMFLQQDEDSGGHIYWLDAGRFSGLPYISWEPCLDGISVITPPVFSPDGSEFLVIDHNKVVHRFLYPPSRPVGSCPLHPSEVDYFTPHATYLNQRLAFVGAGNGRIMLLELDSMQIVDEISIKGHEPRPLNEYFPEMAGLRELTSGATAILGTDITSIHHVNSWLYFVHHSKDAISGPWGRDKHSVLSLSEESVLTQLNLTT